jgi:hypothetical protein
MLYMFQAVAPPIIRSSKLYTQHMAYVKFDSFMLLYSFELLVMGRETS